MKVYKNKSLKYLNTFKVDVKAKEVVFLEKNKDFFSKKLIDVINNKKYVVIGECSNTLFTKDFDGTVIIVNNKGKEVIEENDDSVVLKVAAGENWNNFVLWSIQKNLIGLQNLIEIPGTVGACPIQNIGAYGVEVKSFIVEIEYLNLQDFKLKRIKNIDCKFAYRDSIFKNKLKGKIIITNVFFKLEKYKGLIDEKYLTYCGIQEKFINREVSLNNLLATVKEIRKEKLPSIDAYGSCGSTFKNIEVHRKKYESLEKEFPGLPKFETESEGIYKIPVAYILERLGWKNRREGDVGTWIYHPLIVTNYGNATGGEIFNFIQKMQKDFKERTSLNLDLEINIVK